MNGSSRRSLIAWIVRARRSLPVPLSPSSRIVVAPPATTFSVFLPGGCDLRAVEEVCGYGDLAA